jgi:hypothetical protein
MFFCHWREVTINISAETCNPESSCVIHLCCGRSRLLAIIYLFNGLRGYLSLALGFRLPATATPAQQVCA